MKITDFVSFGDHPLVCRFMKGVFQLKPALPKYTHIWMLRKCCHLTCQTIHKLDLNLMQKLPDRYVFAIGEKLKYTKPEKHEETIELVAYQNKRLCVVGTIKHYVSITGPLRDKSDSKLLTSFRKPPRAVSKNTVAKVGQIDSCQCWHRCDCLRDTQHRSCFDLILR